MTHAVIKRRSIFQLSAVTVLTLQASYTRPTIEHRQRGVKVYSLRTGGYIKDLFKYFLHNY